MGTTHPLPAMAVAPPGSLEARGGNEVASTQILPPAPPKNEPPQSGVKDAIALSGPVALLPVELDVVVPVREFRVRDLLALKPGQLIESQWSSSDDVPLASGKVQLAWSEFEVNDSQLVVRVTRLA